METNLEGASGWLDHATLSRYLAQTFMRVSEGCRFVCYASPSMVLKILRSEDGILRAFQALGIDLGAVTWSPVPGQARASASALRESAFESARLAVERFPEETGCLAFGRSGSAVDAHVPVRADPERAELHLREHDWVLQHRALTLRELISRVKPDEAARRLGDLVDFIEVMWSRGFTDKTFNFLDGFGLVHGKMTLLDVGEIAADPLEVANRRERMVILGSHSFKELSETRPELARALFEAACAKWPEISRNQAISNGRPSISPLK